MPKNRVEFSALVSALSEGISKYLPGTTQLVFNGKVMDGATVVQSLAEFIAASVETDSAKAAYFKALNQRRKLEPAGRELVKGVTTALLAIYGHDPVQLAKYGLTPPKSKRKLSPSEKAAAVEKASTTRKLKGQRGDAATTGSGQSNGTSY
jgi:hypothetical protein